MYKVKVPHKNFSGQPRNPEVCFNLTTHEFLKLLVEFKAMFDWQDRLAKADPNAETPTEEVIEFYTNFEEIILEAWGELDETGDHFRKGGKYDYRESSTHHECMLMYLKDQAELNKMLESLMPEGLQDLIKTTEDNLEALAKQAKENDKVTPAMLSKIEQARADLAQAEAEAALATDSPSV